MKDAIDVIKGLEPGGNYLILVEDGRVNISDLMVELGWKDPPASMPIIRCRPFPGQTPADCLCIAKVEDIDYAIKWLEGLKREAISIAPLR